MRHLLALACVPLAACGGGSPHADAPAADFEPPAPQAPAPLPGQAQTTPLTAYVGRYPNEPLDGVNFFDRTEVATALDTAVTDGALRRQIVRNTGPRTPVFQVGHRIATSGCEAHDCDGHHWTLLVDPASGKGEVCEQRGTQTRWHVGGPPVTRAGTCPSARQG